MPAHLLMPAADHAVATAALAAIAGLFVSVDTASAQLASEEADLQATRHEGSMSLLDSAVYLQDAGPADSADEPNLFERVNTPTRAPFYTRFGTQLLFPQDLTFSGVTTEAVPSSDPNSPGLVDVDVPQDLTLGWGGGLYAAFGYGFAPNARFNPRIEAEYLLLLADFRDAIDDGMTWNSFGLNGIVDARLGPNVKVYGGVGGGLAYVSFANPPVALSSGAGVAVGSDDDVALYVQGLGGMLFRFDDDIDIDLGVRYMFSDLDVFNGDVEMQNVVFQIGLLLHLD
ncbi:MAG: hypothetical protein AAGI46_05400 [Planctomycetota bacterium]